MDPSWFMRYPDLLLSLGGSSDRASVPFRLRGLLIAFHQIAFLDDSWILAGGTLSTFPKVSKDSSFTTSLP